MSSRIQLRRSPAEDWTDVNPTLSEGEAGYETDTGRLKIGDGLTPWNSLGYFNPPAESTSQLTNDSGYITSDDIPENVSFFENDKGYHEPGDDIYGSLYAQNGDIVFDYTIPEIKKQYIEDHITWDTAYSWGDHSVAGYVLNSDIGSTVQAYDADLDAISGLPDTADLSGLLRKEVDGSGNVAWSIDETEYLTTSDDAGNITGTDIARWDAAASWSEAAIAAGDYLLISDAASEYLTITAATNNYQPLDDDLTQIAGLTPVNDTVELLRKTVDGAGTVTWDTWDITTEYLTTTQLDEAYQPLDTDLTAIAALTGTSGFLTTDGAGNWTIDINTYLTSETSHADVVVDGDFPTNGIMVRTGVGSYGTITDNSANWQSAYSWGDHALEGYLREAAVPSGPTDLGNEGDYAKDASYFYVCLGTGNWKRIAWDNTWS